MTLTRKLVLAFAAVIVVPFAALIWVLAGPTIRQTEDFVGARLEDDIVQSTRFIDEMMMSSLREMKSFAASFASSPSAPELIEKRLEHFTYYYPYFTRLSLVAPDGIVTGSTDRTWHGTNLGALSSAPWGDLSEALHSPAGSVLFAQAMMPSVPGMHEGSGLRIAYLAPVHDERGALLGVLIAEHATRQLEDVLADLRGRLPANDHVHLLGNDGAILLSTEAAGSLRLSESETTQMIRKQVRESASGHLIYVTDEGQRSMAGFAHMRAYGDNKAGEWRLVATVAYDTIMQPVVAGFTRIAMVLAAALLAAVFFGVFLARILSRPIRSLTTTAQQLAAGDFSARATTTGGDETAALGQTFNTMAGTLEQQFHALEDSRDALERRVAERTEELREEVREREHSEEELRRSNERFELTMLATYNCIWDWNLETDAVWWNDNLCKVFGYAEEEVGDTVESWTSRIHQDDIVRVTQSIHDAIENGGSLWNDEYRFRRANGEYAWVIDRGYVVRDASGKATRMIGAMQDISRRKHAETELEKLNKQLLDASRRAGMTEIASNVLHNVGNVLNSVNVSVAVVAERIRQSRATNLTKLVSLLREHESDLGAFITSDPRGKHLPAYLAELAAYSATDREECLQEMDSLRRNVDHIKEIVTMQQSYATVSGVKEQLDPVSLVEDSLRMNAGALKRHNVTVVREFDSVPLINVDKHRVLQILVNLIRNAKYACDEAGREEKRVTLRVTRTEDQLQIAVIDNGVGIPAENLTRIFNHGFTTRQGGHGFGLHSGALAAKELGGSLTVKSDGPGMGATFTLELPLGPAVQERKAA
jgi:PAS domain S-box-containing protein